MNQAGEREDQNVEAGLKSDCCVTFLFDVNLYQLLISHQFLFLVPWDGFKKNLKFEFALQIPSSIVTTKEEK